MLLAFLRKVLEVETLPPPPPDAGAPRVRWNLLRALVAPEPLPEDPVAPPRGTGRILRFLLAPEPLPEDPPGPAPERRTHWIAWLFKPEKLDP